MKNFNENEFNNSKYRNAYSNSSFWDKVKIVAKKIGSKGIYYALILYFVLEKPDVPVKDKTIITAALGYFIFPIDIIPDVIPVVGFTDDWAVLLLAMIRVSMYIDEDVKNKSKIKIKEWFSISDSELENLLLI